MTLYDCTHNYFEPSRHVGVGCQPENKVLKIALETPQDQIPLTVEEAKSLCCQLYRAIKKCEGETL